VSERRREAAVFLGSFGVEREQERDRERKESKSKQKKAKQRRPWGQQTPRKARK
jgi:hypothetical protein